MKKTYNTPKLTAHGSIEQLTEVNKTFGSEDGVVLTTINGVPIAPIGSL